MSSDVASDIATEMLGEAAAKGMTVSPAAEEALRSAPVAAQAPPELTPEVEPTAGEEVAEELKAEGEEKFPALPAFKPVPEDEFAQFEEEEAEETLQELKELLDEDDDGYTEHEDDDDLRAKVHKLEKALLFQKEQRAKSERKNWQKEAEERFPLANFTGIQATSRRAFLKAAAESHNAAYRHLSPYLERLEAERNAAIEEAKEKAKQEAIQAWGEPTVGPSVPEIDQGAYDAELSAMRRAGKSLEERLRFMRENGKGGKI